MSTASLPDAADAAADASPASAAAPRVSPWFGIIGMLLVLVVLAASFVQVRQYALLKLSLRHQNDYLVLSLYPLETEYWRLREQWASHLVRPDASALQLRYDIFVSRVALLDTAHARRLLDAVPQAQAMVHSLVQFVQTADAYLGAGPQATLTPTASQALLAQLGALGDGVHQVLQAATHLVAAQVTEREDNLRDQNRVGIALTACLLAMLLLFAAIALRQLRRQELHRQHLQRLAAALRDARIAADAANQAKSQFLTDISHELRTPLNGLLGMLGLVRDAPLDARAGTWLSAADESGKHLLHLLDGLLDPSKLASGAHSLSPEPLAMPAFLAVPTHQAGTDRVAMPGAEPTIASALPTPRRVLVAEDHPVNRQYLLALLEQLGQRTSVVENGQQALLAMQAQDFDLVLMDVHMPVMDGVEATRAIRALAGPAAGTVIAALTADVFADTERRCRDAGVDWVLTKPISRQALAELLAGLPRRGLDDSLPTAAPAVPKPEPAEPGLIDRAVLQSVRELLGAEHLSPAYAGLFDQAQDTVRRMHQALREADTEALRRAAHAVEGAALNFGLPALAEAAGALSRDGADWPAPRLALAVQRFDELVAATRDLCAAEGLVADASTRVD